MREPGSSLPAYGTVEGIAVIGPAGRFPPAGVTLQLSNAGEGPNFAAAAYVAPICFDAGSPILTPSGYAAVEDLRAGDLVETLDHGSLPILWVGSRRAFGVGAFAPVEIASGVLGNDRTIRLSQAHRLLIQDARAELMFGEPEVLASTKSMVDSHGMRIVPSHQVHYHHILLDRHAILNCAGALVESFLPAEYGLEQVSPASRKELERVLPDWKRRAYQPARPIIRSFEASALMAA